MIDRSIDHIDDFAARYRWPISVLAGLWFVISWAATSRFITLPEIPLLTGKSAIFASAAFNGLWWGWLNPRLSRRRAEREPLATENSETANG